MLNCNKSLVMDAQKSLSRKEKDIYRAWLEGNYNKTHLKTTSGESVSIISAGIRNEVEGPDFVDGIVIIGDELLRGPIEIHRNNIDWYEHDHQNDPNYDDVILHVVTRCQDDREIKTANQKVVPTLVLRDYKVEPIKQKKCEGWKELDEKRLLQTLDEYGQQRFNRKSLILKSEITGHDYEQVFYAGVLDVLGYSKNRAVFAKLAAELPIKEIYQFIENFEEDKIIPGLETLYLGIAGLLRDEKAKYFAGDRYYQETRKKWNEIKAACNFNEIENVKWHFVKSRPNNQPPTRILALVQIINNFLPEMPARQWINFIARKPALAEVYQWLARYFQNPSGLWQNHPLLHKQVRRNLLGDRRIMDLLSNYLLPFAKAYGIVNSEKILSNYSVTLSREIKRGAIPGIINKMLGRLQVSPSLLDNNNLLQGSIEFYRNWCDIGLCSFCPLREYAN